MYTFFLNKIGRPARFISVKLIFFLFLNFEFLQFLSTYKKIQSQYRMPDQHGANTLFC